MFEAGVDVALNLIAIGDATIVKRFYVIVIFGAHGKTSFHRIAMIAAAIMRA